MRKEKVIIDFFNQILNMYEFELYINEKENGEKVFKLNDLQGGNLGQIESEEFDNLTGIIDRLDSYHQDYIYRSLEERAWEGNEIIDKDDYDFTVKRYLEDDIVAEILFNITTKNYLETTLPTKNYDLTEIIEVLDEDENIYRNICEKYVKTMSKEMLIKDQDKIKHIFIEDKFIKIKDKGEINSLNYKKYLDENFEVHTYNSYQDLFDYLVRDEIINDLDDLALIENGKWDFYISFDEFKQIGLGQVVKSEFPLLNQYIVKEENEQDFYNKFSLEELNSFEETLHLYYETGDIILDKDNLELYSKSGKEFEFKILQLSEGTITYENFMEEFNEETYTYSYQSMYEILNYFKENNMKDLMQYGADYDEGLYKMSDLYKDILRKIDVDFKSIYTEDGLGDGEYITTITLPNDNEIAVDTNGWSGIKTVIENINGICESYQKEQIKIEKDYKEIDYDF